MPELALKTEMEVYKRELQALLKDEGKYVLIHGEEIGGIYAVYEDALKVGYEKFGVNPFLVKKISATEQIQFFTRDVLESCHT